MKWVNFSISYQTAPPRERCPCSLPVFSRNPGNTDQKNSEYGHFSCSTPNMDYKIFRIPIPIAVSFLIPKKSEKQNWDVLVKSLLFAMNISPQLTFVIFILS